MRARVEIEKEAKAARGTQMDDLLLEVLLDIREVVVKKATLDWVRSVRPGS